MQADVDLWVQGHSVFPSRGPTSLYLGSLGFPDRVYVHAAAIFQKSHKEKPAEQRLINYGKKTGVVMPKAKDEESRQSAYKLAFNSLQYQELLETIIASCPYLPHSLPEDLMCLAVVMLYDLQDRKFTARRRRDREERLQDVETVESCLCRLRTKLAACLARFRVKCNLADIECILPESVKKRKKTAGSLLLYGWVNTLKAGLEEVCDVLRGAGLAEVNSIDRLQGRAFCQDPHCQDVFVFASHLRPVLNETELVISCKLVIQDKTCSVAVNAVRSVLDLKADVLMAGSFSGPTLAHVAAVTALYYGRVLVCEETKEKREELWDVLSKMGCTNVVLIPRSFLQLDPLDVRLERARVILMMPQCSLSAINNPVDFILQENKGVDLLYDLSHGSITQHKLDALVAGQRLGMAQAQRLPKVVAIVYSTCSLLSAENEEVVQKVLKNGPDGSNVQPYSLSSPKSLLKRTGKVVKNKDFFQLSPSSRTNGCFVSVLTRSQQAVEKEVDKDPLESVTLSAKNKKHRVPKLAPLSEPPETPCTPAPEPIAAEIPSQEGKEREKRKRKKEKKGKGHKHKHQREKMTFSHSNGPGADPTPAPTHSLSHKKTPAKVRGAAEADDNQRAKPAETHEAPAPSAVVWEPLGAPASSSGARKPRVPAASSTFQEPTARTLSVSARETDALSPWPAPNDRPDILDFSFNAGSCSHGHPPARSKPLPPRPKIKRSRSDIPPPGSSGP